MTKRSIILIVFGLLCGALIGTLLGELLGLVLPAGVVKDFFLSSINFDLGGLTGQDLGVIVLDLNLLTLKFGLSLKFNFTSLIGLATAYYLLRFFR